MPPRSPKRLRVLPEIHRSHRLRFETSDEVFFCRGDFSNSTIASLFHLKLQAPHPFEKFLRAKRHDQKLCFQRKRKASKTVFFIESLKTSTPTKKCRTSLENSTHRQLAGCTRSKQSHSRKRVCPSTKSAGPTESIRSSDSLSTSAVTNLTKSCTVTFTRPRKNSNFTCFAL